MSKPEHEFHPVDTVAFTDCEGSVASLTERILAQDSRGNVTRILSFAPGTDTTPNGVQRHDFWEEVYILDGSIRDIRIDKTFTAGMYACRPPGMPHGPWVSEDGCTTFEVRYGSDS
ncbi:cupin domain-containing protein [Ornithinimicrobium cryptoxanthini]|uniref:Cupin domain-containing protein n=1 Tax=Ornithinimicrobium cryptoxanthini TaxID=2934161 RepID=A0ABY4YM65_9MICO|nr:cupin domain-containing protein [Ornithinimicrobium cryptoxanthini]USQ77813.1 cupin domain-containing protein [Ornithinimicrobium cryptoxanthini]